MYLISVYFDEKSSKTLEKLIKRVATATGNTFMLDNQVPPHITVTAVETKREDELVKCIDKLVTSSSISTGNIQWVSVGAFMPQVIYIEPVLSEYLHRLSVRLMEAFSTIEDTICSPQYQPFHWLPHCTIGKQLSKEQMVEAFKVLQQCFVPIEGCVTKIGIAKTNPHRDIKVWEL